jgi:hypothetical protein
MKTSLITLLPMLASTGAAGPRGTELLGYLENWVDVKWWDNDIPGNCLMGCFKAPEFISKTAPYSAMNYGFTLLTTNPNPDQVGCDSGPCPVWDGENIYLAAASKQGSHAVDGSTTIETSSPGAVAIAEAVRMARMHPSGPKRVKIVLGGWSDYARLCTVNNAKKAAALMAKLVKITFADGVDLDFEHLTPFDNFTGCDEFGAFQALITSLRAELDDVASSWSASADARRAALEKQFAALQPWQRSGAAAFYNTSILHLRELSGFPAPHLEISYTTRFNAFVDPKDPFAYVANASQAPSAPYATDNEGLKVWSSAVAEAVDTVNVMAYDADGYLFKYDVLFDNFKTLGGVPLAKLNMGFEPGEQAGSGLWEGLDRDKEVAQYVKGHSAGGCFLWGVNPSPQTNPKDATLCPQVASAVETILKPTHAWGPPSNFTKCDPTTGFLPGLA